MIMDENAIKVIVGMQKEIDCYENFINNLALILNGDKCNFVDPKFGYSDAMRIISRRIRVLKHENGAYETFIKQLKQSLVNGGTSNIENRFHGFECFEIHFIINEIDRIQKMSSQIQKI